MTLKKEQLDDVTGECSSYDKVLLGTLETQDSTSMITSTEQRKNRNKNMTEIRVTAHPHDTHMVPLTCKIDISAEVNVIS